MKIIDKFQGKINSVLTGFGRVIIKGHNRNFFNDSGKMYFINEENQDQCLEYTENSRLNDDEARKIIKSIAHVENVDKIQGFEKIRREEII